MQNRDQLWELLRTFIGQWGSVRETELGLLLTWGDEQWETEIEINRIQLQRYVADFAAARRAAGLDDGLANGLPLPLMDSFGACFGTQASPYQHLALQGLEFDVVTTAG